ncbi:MAG TPA: CRTAC1 family protein, partial [Candidatus Udaeobacter sp.]|nr:CRTAC1 family protein [Candidatus Udaeobacter sp.]
LLHNNRDGTFSNVTTSAGVSISGSCWAAVWGDFDNDGYLDLYITNAGNTGQGTGDHNFLFRNKGNGTFTDVAATTGAALQDDFALHKGAAWVDFDNDGFLDLMVKDGIGNENDNGPAALGLHRLLRNAGSHLNHYLEINLRGVQSNGRGIGARVSVTSSNGVAYRQNNGGGGGEYASQGSQPLHFGLGAATSATVVVNWPSGVVDTLQDVPVNQIMTIAEGSSRSR